MVLGMMLLQRHNSQRPGGPGKSSAASANEQPPSIVGSVREFLAGQNKVHLVAVTLCVSVFFATLSLGLFKLLQPRHPPPQLPNVSLPQTTWGGFLPTSIRRYDLYGLLHLKPSGPGTKDDVSALDPRGELADARFEDNYDHSGAATFDKAVALSTQLVCGCPRQTRKGRVDFSELDGSCTKVCKDKLLREREAALFSASKGLGQVIFKHVHKAGGTTLCQVAQANTRAETRKPQARVDWGTDCVPLKQYKVYGACWMQYQTPSLQRAMSEQFRDLDFLASEVCTMVPIVMVPDRGLTSPLVLVAFAL
eukprot:scaffold1529_cov404-Prasinococcus_capsulatus_cf.AAC.6